MSNKRVPADPYQSTKRELRALDVAPRKSRGQNFLQDPAFASELLKFSDIRYEENVIEIGPGLGVLTEALINAEVNLWVVELESEFARALPQKFPKLSHERVIERDIRDVSVSEIAQSNHTQGKFAVVGNVPYSISTDLLFWVIANRSLVSRACFLLQREFAERIAAHVGTRESSAITVHRAMFADARLGPVIGGEAFYPPAKVESRLLLLNVLPEPRVPDAEQELFTKIVRAAFGQRRKTVVNSLLGSGLVRTKDECFSWFERAGVGAGKRPEELEFEDFVKLLRASAGYISLTA